MIVGTGWGYVPIQLYDHHLGFRQVLPDGQQHPGHACADLRALTDAISSEADARDT